MGTLLAASLLVLLALRLVDGALRFAIQIRDACAKAKAEQQLTRQS
jgi:hypothetical protein